MAIFGKKKEIKKETAKVVTDSDFKAVVPKDLDRIILRPRITEKGTASAEFQKAYLFEVATSATKKEIAKAVKANYGVTPIKVRTVQIPAKKVFRRGNSGVKSASKKAYVYLNKKDSIEFA